MKMIGKFRNKAKLILIMALAVLMAFAMVSCGKDKSSEQDATAAESQASAATTESAAQTETAAIDEDGEYWDSEDVALYINTYCHLPDNYVTKREAGDMGWRGGNPVEQCGKSIGGDRFSNREGLLPEGETYYECDVNYSDSSRGPCRLVFTEEGTVYYTEDHYRSFEQLY
ncbi:MAG: ribonuclease domain-containing protein [Bacillota bacterium]|nr:ribonuclease domain-containing protein [Bacillota bacterium]